MRLLRLGMFPDEHGGLIGLGQVGGCDYRLRVAIHTDLAVIDQDKALAKQRGVVQIVQYGDDSQVLILIQFAQQPIECGLMVDIQMGGGFMWASIFSP